MLQLTLLTQIKMLARSINLFIIIIIIYALWRYLENVHYEFCYYSIILSRWIQEMMLGGFVFSFIWSDKRTASTLETHSGTSEGLGAWKTVIRDTASQCARCSASGWQPQRGVGVYYIWAKRSLAEREPHSLPCLCDQGVHGRGGASLSHSFGARVTPNKRPAGKMSYALSKSVCF